MGGTDWFEWHDPYDDPSSPLHRRLLTVQGLVRAALEGAPAGPVRVVSMCAGQGRDLLGVLAEHPRGHDVRARLVELDARNCAVARAAADAAALTAVEVVEADAGSTDAYLGAIPADLVLACGVFGNIDDAAIERTIGALPMLCTSGATVVWTRHRLDPDLTPTIRGWFAAADFEELAFEAPEDTRFGVAAHRYAGRPVEVVPGTRLFTFDR